MRVIKKIEGIEEIYSYLCLFKDEPFMFELKSTEKCRVLADKLGKYGFVFVEYRNDEPIGLISGYANDQVTKTGYVNLMVIKGTSGLASAGTLFRLCQSAWEYGEEQGMKYIRLAVEKHNDRARGIYEKLGFVPAGNENEAYIEMVGDIATVRKNFGKV